MPPRHTAILLMAYGSPNRLEDVEPYFTDIRGGRTPSREAVEELRSRYRRGGGPPPPPAASRGVGGGPERQLKPHPPWGGMLTLKLRVKDASPRVRPARHAVH